MQYVNIFFSVMILGSGCRASGVVNGSQSKQLGDVVYTTPELMYTMPHVEKIKSARFNADGTDVVTTSGPLVWVWWLQKEAERERLLWHKKETPIDAWFEGDSAWLDKGEYATIVTKSSKGLFSRWSGQDGEYTQKRCTATKPSSSKRAGVRLEWDGTTVRILDKKTGSVVSRLSHGNKVTCAELSPNGCEVVVGTDSEDENRPSMAYVWEVAKTLQEIEYENRHKKK